MPVLRFCGTDYIVVAARRNYLRGAGRDWNALLCFLILTQCAAFAAPPRYVISTIAGNGQSGDTPVRSPDARRVSVDFPFGVDVGPDNRLYITTVGSHRVLRLDFGTRELVSVAGIGKSGYAGDGGLATEAALNEPYEVRFDSKGNMIVLEMKNHLLRRVDAKSGVISTIAGDGQPGSRGDGGPASAARFKYPHSIILDERDNIYIADLANHRVRMINARSGIITTVAGNGVNALPTEGQLAHKTPLMTPQGIAIHDAQLWIASFRGQMVWRVDLQSKKLTRFAGTGRRGHSGDGASPLLATFDGPRGVWMTKDSLLYVVEGENNIIRELDTQRRRIRTIAGVSLKKHRFEKDGVPALEAPISQPHGICRLRNGSLVITDTKNHRVRLLTPANKSN